MKIIFNKELLVYNVLVGYPLRLFSEGNMTLTGICEVQSRIIVQKVSLIYLSESVRRGLILIDCDIWPIYDSCYYVVLREATAKYMCNNRHGRLIIGIKYHIKQDPGVYCSPVTHLISCK